MAVEIPGAARPTRPRTRSNQAERCCARFSFCPARARAPRATLKRERQRGDDAGHPRGRGRRDRRRGDPQRRPPAHRHAQALHRPHAPALAARSPRGRQAGLARDAGDGRPRAPRDPVPVRRRTPHRRLARQGPAAPGGRPAAALRVPRPGRLRCRGDNGTGLCLPAYARRHRFRRHPLRPHRTGPAARSGRRGARGQPDGMRRSRRGEGGGLPGAALDRPSAQSSSIVTLSGSKAIWPAIAATACPGAS